MNRLSGGAAVLMVLALICTSGTVFAQEQVFSVIVDQTVNGTLRVDPAPAADGKYAAGTVLTLTATPNPGCVLDSVYSQSPAYTAGCTMNP